MIFTALKLFFIRRKLLALGKVAIKFWKPLLFLFLVGIILYQNKWDKNEFLFGLDTIPNLQAKIIELEKENKLLTEANTALTKEINKTNREILKWKSISDKLTVEHKKALERAKKLRQQYTQKAQEILQQPPPKNCEKAIEYLRDAADEIQW